MSDDLWTVSASSSGFGDGGEWGGVEEAAPIDYVLVGRIQAEVNRALDERARAANTAFSKAEQRQLGGQLVSEYLESQMLSSAEEGLELLDASQERALRDAVLAQMFGLGRLEQLLLDPDVEDIRIPGSGAVLVKLASGEREIREPVAESADDLMTQLDAIATNHGQNARSVTSARPWVDLRLPGHARLAGVWDITPVPYVTIRRHRYVDVTLDRLVELGTLSPAMAAFLEAAVIARRSILVVGDPAVGKTTLLRALCQCLPPTESFVTLETEYELLLHEIPGRFPWLIPYEAREGMGEIGRDGRPAGEVTLADIFPTSLRHSADRCIVGEVRGAEAESLLDAMTRYRGSMGTFHADSARLAVPALSTLLSKHQANWSVEASTRQIAQAVDLIVYIDKDRTRDGQIRYVTDIVEVSQVAENSEPTWNEIFQPLKDWADRDPRGYAVGKPEDQRWVRRAGLDLAHLEQENSVWPNPFPERWGWG